MKYLLAIFRTRMHVNRSLWRAFTSQRITALLMVNGSVLGTATIFYWLVEGWTLLDAAYFSVVTAATVGYGDVTPETVAGKLFTMAFIFVGVGLFVVLATALASEFFTRAKEDPLIHKALEDVDIEVDDKAGTG